VEKLPVFPTKITFSRYSISDIKAENGSCILLLVGRIREPKLVQTVMYIVTAEAFYFHIIRVGKSLIKHDSILKNVVFYKCKFNFFLNCEKIVSEMNDFFLFIKVKFIIHNFDLYNLLLLLLLF